MQLIIYNEATLLAQAVADAILETVLRKPDALLCLGAGDTPLPAYANLVKMALERKVDFSKVHFLGLDEWVGIDAFNSGSCRYVMNEAIFHPLKIEQGKQHFFDGLTADTQKQCSDTDAFIKDFGGIDLMVVGVGMNGHVGFNEPGAPVDLYAHVAALSDTTRVVGQKYFTQPTSITQGFTLGMKHVANARKVLVMAAGSKKAQIMKEALTGDISALIPVSLIRQHTNASFMLDADAASLLPESR